MTYTKRDDIPAHPGETVVELDTGDLVAVSCVRELRGDRLAFQVRARHIGGTALREFVHTATPDCDPDDTARQCLLVALGEPNTLLLSPAVEASYSIRVAIAHAQNVGPVDAGAML